MKLFIIFILSVVFSGCAIFQNLNPEEVQKESVCAAVCATSAAAKCWNSRGIDDLFGPALEVANCYSQCMDNGKVTVDVDLNCIRKADTCTVLEQCLNI